MPYLLAGIVVLLLLVGSAFALTRDDTADQGAPTAPAVTPTVTHDTTLVTEPPPATTYEPPTEEPTFPQIGLVTVDGSSYDQRIFEVARMFDGHFQSINAGDYAGAAAYFDPSGIVDPNDQAQVDKFAEDMNTTRDSDIVLHSIADGPGTGQISAHVTFRSEQAAGKGPHGRPNETCTRWDVTYLVSTSTAGQYRIIRGTTATSEPCYA